jgi:RNA polymerase sigma-70 factor (ECF subfamily)
MEDTEAALVQKIKSGDGDALAAYIAQRSPQLLSFIEKRMSDALRRRVEAADILQDLTTSAWQSLPGVEWGDREPFGWLCQQAERRIIDAHRRHFGAQKRSAGREVNLSAGGASGSGDEGGGMADLLSASMTSPSGVLSRQQKEFHMLAALDSLPEDARDALRMRYVEGLPSKEIAHKLGRTDGAVRVLLTRSLQKLQEILSHNSDFQTLVARQQAGAEREAEESAGQA